MQHGVSISGLWQACWEHRPARGTAQQDEGHVEAPGDSKQYLPEGVPRGTMRTDSMPAFSRSARLIRSGVGPAFNIAPTRSDWVWSGTVLQSKLKPCSIEQDVNHTCQLPLQRVAPREWHLLQYREGAARPAARCPGPQRQRRCRRADPGPSDLQDCRGWQRPPAVPMTRFDISTVVGAPAASMAISTDFCFAESYNHAAFHRPHLHIECR